MVAALVATAAVAVPPAHAGQLADERAQAQALADRIDALGQQESALAERYDSGVISLERANARVAVSAEALASAQAGQARTLRLLEQAALEAYVGGGPQVALAGPVPLKNLNEALLAKSSRRPSRQAKPMCSTSTGWRPRWPAPPTSGSSLPATLMRHNWRSSTGTGNRCRTSRTVS